ncbi:hypothetical protein [Jiella sp. M17.18]|uniref:DUF6894 family protein n=1 Tax=Jiella sp. M17.18 TaxID=3234247 RepID=UPI0034E02AA6
MARYFFDVQDGEDFIRDEEGLACPSREEVRLAAIAALPTMARDALPDSDRHEISVHVRDQKDRPVFRASLLLRAEWLDESS